MLLPALRRFFVILALIALGSSVLALLAAALVGASVSRSLAVGFYVVGSFLMLSGFFIGNRGPTRAKGGADGGFIGLRPVRWATPTEQDDALNSSALFVAIGLGLILLGVATDTRYSLF